MSKMRYTEYHGEVAVIKDKNLMNSAMKKLAEYEDIEEKQYLICQLTKYCNQQEICDNNCIFCTDFYNCKFYEMTIEQLRNCYERIKQSEH